MRLFNCLLIALAFQGTTALANDGLFQWKRIEDQSVIDQIFIERPDFADQVLAVEGGSGGGGTTGRILFMSPSLLNQTYEINYVDREDFAEAGLIPDSKDIPGLYYFQSDLEAIIGYQNEGVWLISEPLIW
jgi:hypothetical protein